MCEKSQTSLRNRSGSETNELRVEGGDRKRGLLHVPDDRDVGDQRIETGGKAQRLVEKTHPMKSRPEGKKAPQKHLGGEEIKTDSDHTPLVGERRQLTLEEEAAEIYKLPLGIVQRYQDMGLHEMLDIRKEALCQDEEWNTNMKDPVVKWVINTSDSYTEGDEGTVAQLLSEGVTVMELLGCDESIISYNAPPQIVISTAEDIDADQDPKRPERISLKKFAEIVSLEASTVARMFKTDEMTTLGKLYMSRRDAYQEQSAPPVESPIIATPAAVSPKPEVSNDLVTSVSDKLGLTATNIRKMLETDEGKQELDRLLQEAEQRSSLAKPDTTAKAISATTDSAREEIQRVQDEMKAAKKEQTGKKTIKTIETKKKKATTDQSKTAAAKPGTDIPKPSTPSQFAATRVTEPVRPVKDVLAEKIPGWASGAKSFEGKTVQAWQKRKEYRETVIRKLANMLSVPIRGRINWDQDCRAIREAVNRIDGSLTSQLPDFILRPQMIFEDKRPKQKRRRRR